MNQFENFEIEFNNLLMYIEGLLQSSWDSQDKGAYDTLQDTMRAIDSLHQTWIDCFHGEN